MTRSLPWCHSVKPNAYLQAVLALAISATIFSMPGAATNSVTTTLLEEPAPEIKPNVSPGLLAYSPNGDFLAAPLLDFPYLIIYARSGDDYTLNANPNVMPTSYVAEVAWSPNSNFLAIEQSVSPFLIVYERTGTTFTKLADPATLPTGEVDGLSWNDDGTMLAASHTNAPGVSIYQLSGSTLTKLANPATIPTGSGRAAKFSPNGDYLAVGHTLTPFITIYSVVGTTFTKLTNPATLPPASVFAAYWSPDSTRLILPRLVTPFTQVYQVSGTSITSGTDFTLNGRFLTASWLDENTMLATHQVAPYMTAVNYQSGVFTPNSNPPSIGLTAEAYGSMSPEGDHFAIADGPPYLFVFSVEGVDAIVTPSATASVTNLVGFDVDPTGTTAIARTENGDKVVTWDAQGLGAGNTPFDTNCVEFEAVTAASENVVFLDCNGDDTVRIKASTLGTVNLPDGCSGVEDEFDSWNSAELTEGNTAEISDLGYFSVNWEVSISEPGFCTAHAIMVLSTKDGKIGLMTGVFSGGSSAAEFLAEKDFAWKQYTATSNPVYDVCGQAIPGNSQENFGLDTLVVATDPTASTVAYRWNNEFPIAGDDPTLSTYRVLGGSLGSAGAVDCSVSELGTIILYSGGATRAFSLVNNTQLWERTDLDASTGTFTQPIAISLDGQWGAVAVGGFTHILDMGNGTSLATISNPSGTLISVKMDSTGQNVWIATTSTIARYGISHITTIDPVDTCLFCETGSQTNTQTGGPIPEGGLFGLISGTLFMAFLLIFGVVWMGIRQGAPGAAIGALFFVGLGLSYAIGWMPIWMIVVMSLLAFGASFLLPKSGNSDGGLSG